MSRVEIDPDAAQFLVDVARALAAVGSGTLTYGQFYVEHVAIGFDGESTNFHVVPNDSGSYDIAIDL